MLHVATVHWQDPRWVEPQRAYLERNAPDGLRVYAALNGFELDDVSGFAHASDMEGTHPEKLNRLGEIIRAEADADDLLLFLDGDAFPIAPVTRELLGGFPLAAVRRDENLGQQQPHPCFCLTTVGFWFEIGGDWRRGYQWRASNGDMVTDAGGNLLGILNERQIAWLPLLRSNRFDLDPVLYAIYGDVVYHHGAGFRPPVTFRSARPGRSKVRGSVAAARVPANVPVLGRLERSLRYRFARRREARRLEAETDRTQTQSDEVFGWIRDDPEFYRRFLDPAAPHS